MSDDPSRSWRPAMIRSFLGGRESSTQVLLVDTDLGLGYLKAMGNPEGDHVLACEWVCAQLAEWFGLPTFHYGVIEILDDCPLPFLRPGAGQAKPGPAFIAKADEGEPWGGSARELKRLINPQDIGRLVIFDTWVLNKDRHFPGRLPNYNNVFLSSEAPPGRLLLRAMDHSHAFTNGRPLASRNLGIDRIRDDAVYGLFPLFRPFLETYRDLAIQAAEDLSRMDRPTAAKMVSTIPSEWDVTPSGREALVDLIVRRAGYLSEPIRQGDRLRPRIVSLLWQDEGPLGAE